MTLSARYILAVCFIITACSEYVTDLSMTPCANTIESSQDFSKAAQLREIMHDVVTSGVPGISITVYSSEGWWHGSDGYAKIEDRAPMQPCHLQYLQSVAKTYMSIGILKLYEEGRVNLDATIDNYLTPGQLRQVTDGKKITVRMLLNHTSGVPEYNLQPKYVTKLLQEPDHYFAPEDYLKYIAGKPLDFAPGTKYRYTNTNYLLLALIGDGVTGDHADYLSRVIFEPLVLKNTYYINDSGYLKYPNLVNSYWDRNSNNILENASRLQSNNVKALVGDDGIVATPEDAVKFLRGLMEGKLLSPPTMDQMKQWVNDKNGNPTYGLGLDYATFDGKIAFGHSGGGIGAGCQLYYFPDQNIYIFVGINLGTVTDSPIHEKVGENLDKIYKVLLN
jgi:D-alanyl-D-alanine carboxypeptidase